MAPRLTGVLRPWMQHDSGYPANWMPDMIRMLPKQVIVVVPAGAGVGVMKEEYGRSLQILLAVCGLVLLIACANVANLLLARAAARRGADGGAPRDWRDAAARSSAQALVESVLLAVAGGLVGLRGRRGRRSAAARAGVPRTRSSCRSACGRRSSCCSFAFGLALVTGIVFGAVPAWFATRTDPIDALRGSGRSASDRSSLARTGLLVVQATLSVVLVAGATMLARSLDKLEHQDFGFRVPQRVVVSLNSPPATYDQPKLTALYREIEERLNRLPGVQGSGLALYNPLTDNWGELIFVSGHPPPKMNEQAGASWDRVSAQLPAEPRRHAGARTAFQRRRQRDRARWWRSSTRRS